MRRRLSSIAAFFLLVVSAVAQSEHLAERSHQAKELMAQGRFGEAVPIYQELVAAVPGNPGLILNLGLAEEMSGHPRQAIPHFQAVLRMQPDSVPALTSLGTCALQTNQPRLAVAPLEKLLQLQPSEVNPRGMLAGAYMSLNRFEEAAKAFRKLTEQNAADPKAWYGLGKAYDSQAASTLRQLTSTAPQSPYVAALLADTRLVRKQYRSAFFFYRQAESKLPALPGLHTGLAKVYESTGHPEWAASARAAERNPSCAADSSECRFLHGDFLGVVNLPASTTKPDALFWKAKAYNQLALGAFDHLGTLPESVEIHALKAQILRGHNQETEAAAEWRAALALAPGDAKLQTELATSLFLAHRYDEVMPMLAGMLPQEPNAPDLNFMMGESLWRTQQAERAVPYLTAALKADPALLQAHAALGMVYAALNQNAEAVPHLAKAVSLDEDGSLHYSLARASQASGDTVQAQKAMREYQQIKQKNSAINDQVAAESEITAPRSN